MATTATMPDCQTAPATAFFGLALKATIMTAAALIMMIWMMVFIFGIREMVASVSASTKNCTQAKATITASAVRNT